MFLHIKHFLASYTFLLLTLLLFLLQPLLPDPFFRETLFSAAISLVIISAVMTMYENRRLHIIIWVLSVPAICVQWLQHVGLQEQLATSLARELFSAFFLGFTSLTIIIHLFAAKTVTKDTLAGAMSSYILIGITFAAFYFCLESVNPGSILLHEQPLLGANAAESSRNFIYFSFTVLTTTGFGDAVPITQAAKSLTMIEAITGQLFLGILIAVLVGKHFTSTNYFKE